MVKEKKKEKKFSNGRLRCCCWQKINSNNTWSMDLIDYFHDLSLLKEGDSINFQKASCTLDGCVKVYSSRVDSVSTETNKLLTGLASASEASEKSKKKGGKGNDDDDENDKGDGPTSTRRKVCPSHPSLNCSFLVLFIFYIIFGVQKTVESSWEALDVKQYDLEFSVDPLFKKTSAEFDEGGVSGLLLNHLQIDRNGRIIFDSSDAVLDSKAAEKTTGPSGSSTVDSLDVQYSLADFSGGILASLQGIWSKEICPSFKTFEFNKSGDFSVPTLTSKDHPSTFDTLTVNPLLSILSIFCQTIAMSRMTGGPPARVLALWMTNFRLRLGQKLTRALTMTMVVTTTMMTTMTPPHMSSLQNPASPPPQSRDRDPRRPLWDKQVLPRRVIIPILTKHWARTGQDQSIGGCAELFRVCPSVEIVCALSHPRCNFFVSPFGNF